MVGTWATNRMAAGMPSAEDRAAVAAGMSSKVRETMAEKDRKAAGMRSKDRAVAVAAGMPIEVMEEIWEMDRKAARMRSKERAVAGTWMKDREAVGTAAVLPVGASSAADNWAGERAVAGMSSEVQRASAGTWMKDRVVAGTAEVPSWALAE